MLHNQPIEINLLKLSLDDYISLALTPVFVINGAIAFSAVWKQKNFAPYTFNRWAVRRIILLIALIYLGIYMTSKSHLLCITIFITTVLYLAIVIALSKYEKFFFKHPNSYDEINKKKIMNTGR
ncbi:hypothetical protein [Pedobacter sp.]|uniref:hypothetical protein n=1 Tax=Pedobacter sp. TaxID=1411316 RepID=UPI002BCAE168|nr:hypothetical protein [Pedobacter sp.]HWW37870.1 hypothetical protein [Pedobacter sp.]